MNTATAISATRYGKLLADAQPKVIETRKEYERALSIIKKLMELDEEDLPPEEAKLLELLVTLTDQYEEAHYPISRGTPQQVLHHLMESRGLSHKDIWPAFGSKGVASEVLNGKRSISKTHARKLAAFFKVPADLFI
jgi:HTH-type transcriptional regulator / antitoxin HigA